MSISTVITLGYGSFGNTGYVITLGYDTSATPPTPPAPAPSGGSGGVGRYFGYSPERKRELKAEIRSIVREKKAIERRFKSAPSNVDLARLAALLTELQQRLNALVVEYEEMIHVWQAETRSRKAQEEDEEFLVNLFSESFYE